MLEDILLSGLYWDDIGVMLGLYWADLGIILGLYWGDLEVISGYIGLIMGLY